MITQRLVADLGSQSGRVTIECVPGSPNGLAELMSLHEELKLRANINTEGSIITQPAAEDIPPPVE